MNAHDAPPPHSIEAEEATIGAIMAAASIGDLVPIQQALGIVQRDDFYVAAHQKILDVVASLHRQRVLPDIVAVASDLDRSGDLVSVGGPLCLQRLVSGVATVANVAHYARIVHELGTRRAIMRAGRDAMDEAAAGQRPAADILRDFTTRFGALVGTDPTLDLRKASRTFGALLADNESEPVPVIGEHVGAGEYAIIAGPKAASKTMLVLDAAINSAIGGEWCGIKCRAVRVGIISLELKKWQVRKRLQNLCAARGIPVEAVADRIVLLQDPELSRVLGDEQGYRGGVDILDQRCQAAIIAWGREEGIELLIVDTLTEAHTADEKDLRPVMRASNGIAAAIGCALVYVHHSRKRLQGTRASQSSLAHDESRGDSRFVNRAKLVAMVSPKGSGLVHVSFTVNIGKQPEPVWFIRQEDGTLRQTNAPVEAIQERRHRAAVNQERVKEAVEQIADGWFPASALEAVRGELGVSERTLRTYLGALVEARSLERRGKGKGAQYRLANPAVSGSTAKLPEVLPKAL